MARHPVLKDRAMALKLTHHIETALSQAAGSMTGKTFHISALEGAQDQPPVNDPIVWQQTLSAVEGPSLWIVAGKDLWESLGHLTFEAAGLDEITEIDCRSTWLEIVTQTATGVASGISSDLGREVTLLKGEEIAAEPQGLVWTGFSVAVEADREWFFKAAWTPGLAGLGEPRSEESRSPAVRDRAVSNTFDLLLDVALPVSVSFGKTSLQVREVLKLNTGSIVELDRFVTDPVEVIVNNCVIARGEVVVVDGNYGVRINQLASRDERLRSGMSEAARKAGVRP
jgi:flagellar motor switch protein FliN